MGMAVRRTPFMEKFWKFHIKLYAATGGKIGGKVQGMPVLLLTTKGCKSGEPRTVALMYIEHEGNPVVIASNAGEPKDPAWWKNLEADPNATVQRGKDVMRVRAREARGEEREAIWKKLVATNDAYDTYQSRTERTIPVVVLEPVS